MYKQLKQNSPSHFFYGESINAILIQTWVVLIANLLITVLSRSIQRKCAFPQVVTMVCITLMYYIDFISFMNNPDKTWNDIIKMTQKKTSATDTFLREGLTFKIRYPKLYFSMLREGLLYCVKIYQTAINQNIFLYSMRWKWHFNALTFYGVMAK